MGKLLDSLTDHLKEFIGHQHVFFVATAPLKGGHVNLSPKGHDCFRVLGDNRVAYLDLTGSGNETSAHLAENGRITLMFCAFDGPPNILRLYGTGRVVLPGAPDWDDLYCLFTPILGTRQIIVAEIDQLQTSCGFAVPFYEYTGERETLVDWAEKKGEDGLQKYRAEKNVKSLDELPIQVAVE